MRRGWTLAIVAVVVLVTVSCARPSDDDVPDGAAPLEPTSADDAAGDDGQTGDVDDGPVASDDPEAFAVADAAQRAGVDATGVTVVVNEDVTWTDGALGCPQPDQFYTQALVEGYRVVVEADGERFHYHGRAGQPPAYCADPTEPADDGGGVVDR